MATGATFLGWNLIQPIKLEWSISNIFFLEWKLICLHQWDLAAQISFCWLSSFVTIFLMKAHHFENWVKAHHTRLFENDQKSPGSNLLCCGWWRQSFLWPKPTQVLVSMTETTCDQLTVHSGSLPPPRGALICIEAAMSCHAYGGGGSLRRRTTATRTTARRLILSGPFSAALHNNLHLFQYSWVKIHTGNGNRKWTGVKLEAN